MDKRYCCPARCPSLNTKGYLSPPHPHPCKAQCLTWELLSICWSRRNPALGSRGSEGDSSGEVGSHSCCLWGCVRKLEGACNPKKCTEFRRTQLFQSAGYIFCWEHVFFFFGWPCFKSFLRTWQSSGASFLILELFWSPFLCCLNCTIRGHNHVVN